MKIVNITGKKGEDIAVLYLKKLGYKILKRNFRKNYGEIDIIALDLSNPLEKILVFIEVKTRTSGQFGSPLEAITHWKLQALIKTAHVYKAMHPKLPESLRIDAISVLLSPSEKGSDIEHVKNISA